MNLILDVQRVSQFTDIPTDDAFFTWVCAALDGKFDSVEVTIRIVNMSEMIGLNKTYRHKDGPTNVLSFPFEQPADVPVDVPLLGDIVICAEVISKEAAVQHKTVQSHWAHMVVHGCLHLLGFDHIHAQEADEMENKEVTILKTLGFSNPYAREDVSS